MMSGVRRHGQSMVGSLPWQLFPVSGCVEGEVIVEGPCPSSIACEALILNECSGQLS